MNIQKAWNWLWNPPVNGPRATVAIRLMTGGVFLWEGILKFVYTNQGVGRFTKLGIPFPIPTAHFVAWVEIIGGILLILGWLTRPVAIAFIIEMIVAILSTKISLFLGTFPLPLPSSPPQVGMWAVLHEVRSDYAQIMTSIFLLIAGPGPIAMDAQLAKESYGIRTSRLVAAAVLLLLVVGTARASGSASAGASSTPAVAENFALGQKAVKQEDYKTAAQFFERALAEQPNNPDVLNMLAFSERKQGNLDEAFEYYSKALALRPQFPEAREYVAEAHIQAALKELRTLRGYGSKGKEEAEDVVQEFKEVVKNL
jgi:putative oxidoreductase